jgi:hypothetical protein
MQFRIKGPVAGHCRARRYATTTFSREDGMDEQAVQRFVVHNLRNQPLELVDGVMATVVPARQTAVVQVGTAGAGQLLQMQRRRLVIVEQERTIGASKPGRSKSSVKEVSSSKPAQSIRPQKSDKER